MGMFSTYRWWPKKSRYTKVLLYNHLCRHSLFQNIVMQSGIFQKNTEILRDLIASLLSASFVIDPCQLESGRVEMR